MRRAIVSALSVALMVTACTAEEKPEPEPDLPTRIAEDLKSSTWRPKAVAIADDQFAFLAGTDDRPEVAVWTADDYTGGVTLEPNVTAVTASPAQLDVDTLISRIDARRAEGCDPQGFLMAVGDYGPPLMVTGCGPVLEEAQYFVGDVSFAAADGWHSADAMRFLMAFTGAVGDPRVARFSVTGTGASLAWVADAPSTWGVCLSETVTFGDGVPIFGCDNGVALEPAGLPRLGAAGPDLADRIASALEGQGDDSRVELGWADAADPVPLLRVGTPGDTRSIAIYPGDEEAVRAHDGLPAVTATTWPESVAGWKTSSRPVAEPFTSYLLDRGDPKDRLVTRVSLLTLGSEERLPVSDAGTVTIDGARCTFTPVEETVSCATELGGGAYLAGTIEGHANRDTPSAKATQIAGLLKALGPLITAS
ncbi:hypothetical protein BW730_12305 [Tessaracoccus aquimaris]|uniref:Lipoprotein n=1 Tax=Tessaracoccus aquimaris TaxID=1332264 RepID=A0A1Q2CPX9_9ACTN|nr:hypothetical protein [Tessaracoccus aquimaris]AQP48162.1 hypothetical protein BW730_12305 [Tessaracoccus aquimaris]